MTEAKMAGISIMDCRYWLVLQMQQRPEEAEILTLLLTLCDDQIKNHQSSTLKKEVQP